MWVIGLPLSLVFLLGVLAVVLGLPQHLSIQEAKPVPAAESTHPAIQTPASAPKDPPPAPKKEEPLPSVAPETPATHIEQARAYFLSGNLTAARGELAGVDLDQARSPLGWEMAGLLKEADGDTAAAMELYSKGLTIGPSERLYYHRALLYRANGDLELALEDMDRAAAIDPDNIVTSNERLLLMIQMGRKEQAREELSALSLSARQSQADSGAWIFALCGLALENGEYVRGGDFLGQGKNLVNISTFEQMLKNPVISRHMTRPEIMPFYITNLSSQ